MRYKRLRPLIIMKTKIKSCSPLKQLGLSLPEMSVEVLLATELVITVGAFKHTELPGKNYIHVTSAGTC